jgi:hypothetical protein
MPPQPIEPTIQHELFVRQHVDQIFLCVRVCIAVPRREIVSYTPYSDRYLWRKYGQKRITNTSFPR